MTLDDCVYALSDLLDKHRDHNIALEQMEKVLEEEKFSIEDIIVQFKDDYKCTPEVYIENLFDDEDWNGIDE